MINGVNCPYYSLKVDICNEYLQRIDSLSNLDVVVIYVTRFACSLLRQGMKQIIVGLETPEIKAIEDSGDKNQIAKVSRDSIIQQIADGNHQIELDVGEDAPHALIIDGKSLMYALEDDLKQNLLRLAVQCASVICCRVSPKQKALVCTTLCCYFPTQFKK